MIIARKIQDLVGVDYSAYIVMLIANIIWSSGMMLGAENKYGTVFYIGVARGVITVIFSYAVCKALGYRVDVNNTKDFWICFWRAIITAFQQIITVFGLHYLPPSLLYTITSIGPIIVFIIDYFKNQISVTSRQILGVIVATVGLIVAVNSLLIMSWLGYQSYEQNSKFHYQPSTLGFKMLVCLIVFIEYIFWAYAMVTTKDLKQTNPVQLSFFSGIIYLWVGAILTYPYPNTRVINFYELLYDILVIGGLITFATYLYMLGLTLSKKTGNLTMTNFSTVIFGFLISIVRYGETPNSLGIGGSVFIFVGLFLVLIKKQQKEKEQEQGKEEIKS